MEQSKEKKFNYDTIKDLVELNDLPENVVISTITITFSLNNYVNTLNFAKYVNITEKGITKIIYGSPPENLSEETGLHIIDPQGKYVVRTFYPIFQKRKRLIKDHSQPLNVTNSDINEINNNIEQQKMKQKTKRKCSENNQCRMKIWSSVTNKCVSVSVFNNGSVHITGIKTHLMFEEIYTLLLNELNKKKYIYDPVLKSFVHEQFLENELTKEIFTTVNDFQICMINCTVDVFFNIKLNEAETLMKSLGAPTKLDVSKHACVNTKYNYKNFHEVSIFIFETGKINITGSRNLDEIISAYEYIVEILYDNFKKLLLINVEGLDPEVIRSYAN